MVHRPSIVSRLELTVVSHVGDRTRGDHPGPARWRAHAAERVVETAPDPTTGMSTAREQVLRSVVAILVLPHEGCHALFAWGCRLEPEVTILPSWAGSAIPLARFNATLEEDTPTLFIRAVAVAPLLVTLVAAGLVGAVLPSDSVLVVPLLVVLSFWGSLSSGDLAIAAQPALARDYGEFLVPRPAGVDSAALLLTPLTVVGIGLLLLW